MCIERDACLIFKPEFSHTTPYLDADTMKRFDREHNRTSWLVKNEYTGVALSWKRLAVNHWSHFLFSFPTTTKPNHSEATDRSLFFLGKFDANPELADTSCPSTMVSIRLTKF